MGSLTLNLPKVRDWLSSNDQLREHVAHAATLLSQPGNLQNLPTNTEFGEDISSVN